MLVSINQKESLLYVLTQSSSSPFYADVVYIGTLNPQHYEVSLLMLNNGKHVLCEKPLAMNKKQVEGILAAAKANKRFFMEAVWSRFFPSYEHVRQLIQTGALGEIKDVVVNFGFPLAGVERLQ